MCDIDIRAHKLADLIRIVRSASSLSVVKYVLLYGSTARGDFDYDSDIDVMLIVEDCVKRPIDSVYALEDLLGAKVWEAPTVDIHAMRKTQFNTLDMEEPFNRNLHKEAKVLWRR